MTQPPIYAIDCLSRRRLFMMQWLAALAILCFCIMHVSKANAQGAGCAGYGSIPINEIYKYDPAPILNCILNEAADPPREWLCRGSGFCATPTAKVLAKLNQPIVPANRPNAKYEDKGCNTYAPTKAGGFVDQGATDACILGAGRALASIGIIQANVPIVGQPQIACLTNLLGGLTGAFSGGGTGGFGLGGGNASGNFNAGPFAGSGGASVGQNGACLGGNVGVCGLSIIGGTVCTGGGGNNNNNNANTGLPGLAGAGGQQPFSRLTPPQYVAVNGVANYNYVNNTINQNTGIYVPNGGVVRIGGTSYTVPQNGFVTISPTGQLFIGPNQFNQNNGIQLQQNQVVQIQPQGGQLLIDGGIFAGNTVGVPSSTIQVNTVQPSNGGQGQVGQVSFTNTPNTGATAQPTYDPTLVGGVNGPSTGSFAANPIGAQDFTQTATSTAQTPPAAQQP